MQLPTVPSADTVTRMLHGPGPHSRSELLGAGLSTASQASHMAKQAAELFEAAGGFYTAAEAAK